MQNGGSGSQVSIVNGRSFDAMKLILSSLLESLNIVVQPQIHFMETMKPRMYGLAVVNQVEAAMWLSAPWNEDFFMSIDEASFS